MDDFTLSLCGGFPAQEVIVGGDYSLGGDLSPDISHFFGHEEIIFEDLDSGLTSSSDDLNPPSLSPSSHQEDDIINVRFYSIFFDIFMPIDVWLKWLLKQDLGYYIHFYLKGLNYNII